MGISKRELLEDYYPDELVEIVRAWGELSGMRDVQEAEETGVTAFLDL